ncbi:MAG: hypothetical protein KGP14_04205 [Betaproteobacteria bacterium]|nr:hypothetical protein [Betaproteobacteria bacterium]
MKKPVMLKALIFQPVAGATMLYLLLESAMFGIFPHVIARTNPRDRQCRYLSRGVDRNRPPRAEAGRRG